MDKELKLMLSIGAVALLAIAGLCYWAQQDQDRWEAGCRARGGHVDSSTATGTGISTSGKPVVSTTTTYYCLTADGRILEVR